MVNSDTSFAPIDFQGRLVVHVGPHKTGSTSIQNMLDSNYDILRQSGVLYPKAGRQENGKVVPLHHPLIFSLIGIGDWCTSTEIEALRSEISSASPSTVVLSSEVLSRGNLSSQAFRDLQEIFPNALRSWIIYLRRQDRLAVSRYAHDIKRGRVAWMDLRNVLRANYLDHRLRLERLHYAVGNDLVIPVPFDDKETGLLDGFVKAAGIQIEGLMLQDTRNNESLPWGTLYLARMAQKLPGPLRRFARRGVFYLSRRILKTRARRILDWPGPLSSQRAAEIRKQYEASNLWVEATYWNGRRFLTGD